MIYCPDIEKLFRIDGTPTYAREGDYKITRSGVSKTVITRAIGRWRNTFIICYIFHAKLDSDVDMHRPRENCDTNRFHPPNTTNVNVQNYRRNFLFYFGSKEAVLLKDLSSGHWITCANGNVKQTSSWKVTPNCLY